jgi:hypothetical protein
MVRFSPARRDNYLTILRKLVEQKGFETLVRLDVNSAAYPSYPPTCIGI